MDSGTQARVTPTAGASSKRSLATEQKSLEAARKELEEQEFVRYGNERNYQKVLDRVQPYKDKVQLRRAQHRGPPARDQQPALTRLTEALRVGAFDVVCFLHR